MIDNCATTPNCFFNDMKVPGLIPSTLAFSLATLVLSALTSAAQAERPNVIVIMSDDQGGGDYGFMGNEIIRTP